MPDGGEKWKAIVSCSLGGREVSGAEPWNSVQGQLLGGDGRCRELKVTLRCMPLATETCCLDKCDCSHLLSSRGDEGLEVSVDAQQVKLISYTFIFLQDGSISCSFRLFITTTFHILLGRGKNAKHNFQINMYWIYSETLCDCAYFKHVTSLQHINLLLYTLSEFIHLVYCTSFPSLGTLEACGLISVWDKISGSWPIEGICTILQQTQNLIQSQQIIAKYLKLNDLNENQM